MKSVAPGHADDAFLYDFTAVRGRNVPRVGGRGRPQVHDLLGSQLVLAVLVSGASHSDTQGE